MAGKEKAIAIGLGIGAGILLLSTRKAKGAPMSPVKQHASRISVGEFFTLDEFLRSKSLPQLADYTPTNPEFENLKALTSEILDPSRKLYGPVTINSGGRPDSVAAKAGTTWEKLLNKAGYNPAEKSDHADFSAADIVFPRLPASRWVEAYRWISALPSCRQAILYTVRVKAGVIKPTRIHVAVVRPGKPAFQGRKQSFVVLDEKQLPA